MNETQLTLQDENGNDVLFDIVHSFYNEEFNKSYVLLVPAEGDDDEEIEEIYPYVFTLNDEGSIDELFPVESDEEWDMIENELESLNEALDQLEEEE
jgi:uncharacterized protein YrzB (UPF0473 family)